MTKKTLSILLFAACAVSWTALAEDTVILKNGDVLTGQILEETSEHVYFKSHAFGAVSLQNKDIAEVRFQTDEHGEVATQPAAPSDSEPAVQMLNPDEFVGPLQISPEEIEETVVDRWSGQTGLSIAIRESVKSNAEGVTGTDQYETYRFYGDMAWQSNKNRLHWKWTYRYSRDEYDKQDDYLNVTQHYTHDFRENYYATAKTMYQRDYRRKITNEYLQTAEMGVKWIALPALEFSTSAGGGYHQYDRMKFNAVTQMDEELSITQPKFIFDESLRWQIIQSLSLIQKYTHLGDLKDYHFIFTAGLENKLVHDIFLRMEYRLDRDTEVYYDDRGYYDKALLTSLLYKF